MQLSAPSFSVTWALPSELVRWAEPFFTRRFTTDEERMSLAVDLSSKFTETGGGPFGAAIFVGDQLCSVGVNLVVPVNNSTLHAEMVAFQLAQVRLGRFRLGGGAAPEKVTLASSAEMCGQCSTGLLWAGVDRVIFGATTEDVERLTSFDEGIRAPDRHQQIIERGVEVIGPCQRSEACRVLERYTNMGGVIYNGVAPTQK